MHHARITVRKLGSDLSAACLWGVGGPGDVVQDVQAGVREHAPHVGCPGRAQQHHCIQRTRAVLRTAMPLLHPHLRIAFYTSQCYLS